MELRKEIRDRDKAKCEHLLRLLDSFTQTNKYSTSSANLKPIGTLYLSLLSYVFSTNGITFEEAEKRVADSLTKIDDESLVWILKVLVYES